MFDEVTTGDAGVADEVSSAADDAADFQGLFEAGAFDPNDAVEKPKPGEAGDAAPEAPEAEQPPAWSNLDEFISSAKGDPEAIRALPVTVKIDGQERQVPLSDVIKSFQLEGHVNNKSIALSQERQQFEAERGAARTLLQQQVQNGQALAEHAVKVLNKDFERIDWNALRQQNPAEYMALQLEFQNRQTEIRDHMTGLQAKAGELQQQQVQELQRHVAAEREKMQNAVPEWKDEIKFRADRDGMVSYAKKLGFSEAELSGVFDHRFMRMAHDAARFAALQASAPNAVKQVREAPKTTAKPGSRTGVAPAQAQRAAVIERFNKNPTDLDAQEAMFGLFE